MKQVMVMCGVIRGDGEERIKHLLVEKKSGRFRVGCGVTVETVEGPKRYEVKIEQREVVAA
jgi:hypothetical protein